MTRSAPARLFAFLCLAAALGAQAAQQDTIADAALGKPDLLTRGNTVASATNLVSATGVVEDPVTGAIWVSDESRHRVLRYSSAAAFATGEAANLVLGQADFTSGSPNRGGAAAANTFSNPTGLAVDQGGRLYVADALNHRVLVFRPPFANGMSAWRVIGQATFTANSPNRGATTAANGFSLPTGLALDRLGNLFVADYSNNRVLRFDAPVATGEAATKVFGQGGSFVTNLAATTAAGLSSPVDVGVDGADNLWIVDAGNSRALRFDAGAAAGDATADIVLCQTNFTAVANGGNASQCTSPIGIAVDRDGSVYLSDESNHRVLFYATPATGAAAIVTLGQPDFITPHSCNQGVVGSPTASTLCVPKRPRLDRQGNLLVPDFSNGRVLRFDLPLSRVAPAITTVSPSVVPQDNEAFVLTVNGSAFYANSVVRVNGVVRTTQFVSPERLLAMVPAGAILSLAPVSVRVDTPAPGGGTTAILNISPYARAPLDATADRVLGQPSFTATTALNPVVGEEQVGPAGPARFVANNTGFVAIDRNSGRLFISDRQAGGRVLSWPSVSAFHNAQSADVVLGRPDEFTVGCDATTVTAASLCAPQGLAIDGAGALYVADSDDHRVLKFVPPFSTGMAATRVFGQNGSFTTRVANSGGRSANSLNTPVGLAIQGGVLAVHDANNRRILLFNQPDADTTADVVIGQPDMASANILAVGAGTVIPSDGYLAFDLQGRLFYSAANDNRVLRYSPPFSNGMNADLVIGQAAFTTNATAATATGLFRPAGIAFDPAGNLLVVDSGYNRLLRYVPPFLNGMAATGVLGQTDFTSTTFGASATKLRLPSGVAYDRVGNVLAVDPINSRVLAFDRPFAFALDPAGDLDGDGIPNAIEPIESRDPYAKDNDIFTDVPTGPRLFTMQQYRDFLSREGDPGGVVFWTGQITTAAQTRAQAIQGFFSSPEFQGVIAPVARLYFANFLRYPDYVGLQFHVARSRTGTALDVIANDFATSPEFVSRYGALTNDAFIDLVYQNVLGRPADPGGKAFWLSQMAGGATRGQVMLGFSESPEYVAAIGNEVFITMMYVGMLRRAPDPVGFGYWLTQLDGGQSSLGLTQGFLDAPEYRNRFLP